MAAESEEGPRRRWYFTKEQLANSPSRADGVDPEKELSYRQDAASLIQDMGPRLNLNPLCMSTAIVYMHRFYMINSFKAFNRAIIATAALFLAAKVEEHPRKLEHVAKCSYSVLHKDKPALESQSEIYAKTIDDITSHELILLQTLGFDVQVRHPHPHVVECMNLVGVSRDLSQAAFFLAHNSQLLTTFCLEHPPTVVACMCIHLTCAWKGLEIPRSSDNKNWWEYVDKTVTWNKLEELAKEFLTIVDKSPSRLRKRIHDNIRMAVEGTRPHSGSSASSNVQSSTHGSTRHPPAAVTSTSSSFKHKERPSSSHHNPSPSVTKHHSRPHHTSQTHTKPHPTQSTKTEPVQRISPPPPPPPPTHSEQVPTDSQKSRKHKETYHHSHNSKTHNDITNRSHKHSLSTDPSLYHQKHKRLKVEEPTPTPHKQPLSLSDYRQSKRQQQYQHIEGEDPSHFKYIKTEQQHNYSHHSKQSLHNSLSEPTTKPLSLPPLPPPLPSSLPNESPPPPPPPPDK